MAAAVMGPLVGRLQELAVNEARAMVAVNDDVRSLRDKLLWMQAYLRDAEPRRRGKNDELVRVCLQQTRDAIFDAEDAVDQYFLRVDLSRYPRWSRAILKFFKAFTIQVRVRRDLSRRIRSINTRLESIIANKDKYKIDDAGAGSITTWRPSTAISVLAEKPDDFELPLVGRDHKLQELENALIETETESPSKNKTRETKGPVVISVIGKSGVGKTKLVKEIYQKHSTKNHFHVMAWASFAPNLSAPNILKLILLRLTEGGVKCSKHEAGKKLQEELSDKKYLLVIDGEVSSTEWKRILTVLSTNNAQSRVVRITQTKPEAPTAGKIIKVNHFKEKDTTTDLFLATLFMDNKSETCSKKKKKKSERHGGDDEVRQAIKEKHADFIFNVTGGLPLAVVLLSGLLRTKEYPGEWHKVIEHLKDKSNEWKRLDSILSMCFDDLPHDMKSCFLYFAAFPVNTLLKARTLECMWMAEGFLEPKEGKTMEKVGRCYLTELIHRRLLNLPPLEHAAPGDERVTVQSRVHDFLLLEAKEANFVEIHSGDDVPTLSTARRLSLQNHRDKYAALADPLPKLRSILSNFEKEDSINEGAETKEVIPNAMLNRACPCLHPRKANSNDLIRNLLQGSQFLRVISLDGLEIGDKLPDEIENVVHLHYLGITSCSLEVIPSSIGKLTRLQTLDVRGTKVIKLPSEFWRIRTLRHVFGSLVLPKRIGRHLEQLQTLATLKLDEADGGWDERVFANMKRLRSLYIWGISTANVHILSAVYTLNYLVLLIIHGEVISLDLFTRASILPRLQVMGLTGKIEPPLDGNHEPSSHPAGSNCFYLPNLTKLSLKRTKVSQYFIDKLGELPFLTTLALFQDSYKEECLVFADKFQSLKDLTLDLDLKIIVIKELAFPDLVNLEIFIYSSDLRVEIHDRPPNFVDKIKLEDKTNKLSMMSSIMIYGA